MSTSRETLRKALPLSDPLGAGRRLRGFPRFLRNAAGTRRSGRAGVPHAGRTHARYFRTALLILFALLFAAAPLAARGVLLYRPSEQTGAPMYPARVSAFYTSVYDFDGHEVAVYYTDSDIDPPETQTVLSCGGEEVAVVTDPDFEIRLLELEGERIFFVWEAQEESGEFDLCEYTGYFAERYRFFASEFPERMRERLPGVIEPR